jgi:RNA-directed DNA polymerase
MLQERVADESLVRLIGKWMKVGVVEEGGKEIHPEAGTPQGGIISPILANLYLHYVLDLWFEKRMKKQLWGRAKLFRYADDCAPRARDWGMNPDWCATAQRMREKGPSESADRC